MTALTVYGCTTASTTLVTANQLLTTTGGGSTGKTTKIGTATGYSEVYSQSTATAWDAAGSIGAPSGHGWLWDATTLEGQQIAAGTWQPIWNMSVSVGTLTADIIVRAYKYNGGVYTLIGTCTFAAQTFTTTNTRYTFSTTSLAAVSFDTGDKLYIDNWLNITGANSSSAASVFCIESSSATLGDANIAEVITPGYGPAPVVLTLASVVLASVSTLTGTLAVTGALALATTIRGASALTTSGAAYPTVIMAKTPSVYYRMDEVSGTVATDQTANAYNGTISATGITYSQRGVLLGGTALGFDGTNGVITVPSGLKTDGWSAFSVEAWVNLTDNTTNLARIACNDNNPVGTHVGWRLVADFAGDGSAGYFDIGNGTTGKSLSWGSVAMPTGGWNHLVATYDGSNVRVYQNGTLVAGPTALAGTIGTATHPITIGNFGAGGSGLIGRADEVAIYHATLSAAQILTDYQTALFPSLTLASGVALAVTMAGVGTLVGTWFTTTYYISTTGSDSNNGTTTGAAFATFNHAQSVAVPGDIIRVLPGTYNQLVSISCNGTAGGRITFLSDTPLAAHITSPSARSDAVQLLGTYLDFIGFDVSSTNCRVGIYAYNSYVRIIGNYVHDIPSTCDDTGGAGIDGGYNNPTDDYTAHDLVFDRNIVARIGGTYPTSCDFVHGIYCGATSATITNNIIYQCAGAGLVTNHGAQHITIANNLVFSNAEDGISLNSDSTQNGGFNPADYFILNNNILIHNALQGINVHSAAAGTHNQYGNNLIFGNTGGPYSMNGTPGALTPVAASGSITTDPLLVNYQANGSGDYHLTASSPCIDAATSTGAPTTDYDGNPRPFGASYDIGPYEYTGVALTCTIPGVGTLAMAAPTFKTALASTPIPGTGTISGTATLAAALAMTIPGSSTCTMAAPSFKTALVQTLAGAGVGTFTLTPSFPLLGTIGGHGVMSMAAPTETTGLNVTIAGAGTLAPQLGAAYTMTGGTLAGVGTMTMAAPSLATALTDTASGTGTLSGTPAYNTALAGTMVGVGTLTMAAPTRMTALTGSLVGVGTLTMAVPTFATTLTGQMAGRGNLTPTILASLALSGATMPGIGTLTMAGPTLGGGFTGTMVGIGVMAPTITVSNALQASLSGAGSLTMANPSFASAIAALMAGQGTLAGTPSAATAMATSTLPGTSGFVAAPVALSTALSGQLSGAGASTAAPSASLALTVQLTGVATLVAALSGTGAFAVTTSGAGVITSTLSATTVLIVAFTGTGQMSGNVAESTALSGVSCAGTGTLTGQMALPTTALSCTMAGSGQLSGAATIMTALSPVTITGDGVISLSGAASLASALSIQMIGASSLVMGGPTLGIPLGVVMTAAGTCAVGAQMSAVTALFLVCAGTGLLMAQTQDFIPPQHYRDAVTWVTRDLKTIWVTRDEETQWTTRG